MRVGVPSEVKDHEYRIGMIPAAAHELSERGHEVLVQDGAGEGSGITNQEFVDAGAKIVPDAAAVYGESEMVVKVKEPVACEYDLLREGQTLYTYLHLAPLPELTNVLLAKKITGVAYETITDRNGRLPLLTPMSEVAGRMSTLVGAYFMQRRLGGRGTLLGGVPGVPPGDVVIIGGGVVGLNAARIALGLGARVTIVENNLDRARYLDEIFHGQLTTLASNRHNIVAGLSRADLVIGAVLVPGYSAPKLVNRDLLAEMKPGSVIVDVAVDQGGCFETTKATTHSEPTYEVDGVVHYGVTNMPGAVPRTSTYALNNATMPHLLSLADLGAEEATRRDPHLAAGVNTYAGEITCGPVAESQDREHRDLADLLA